MLGKSKPNIFSLKWWWVWWCRIIPYLCRLIGVITPVTHIYIYRYRYTAKDLWGSATGQLNQLAVPSLPASDRWWVMCTGHRFQEKTIEMFPIPSMYGISAYILYICIVNISNINTNIYMPGSSEWTKLITQMEVTFSPLKRSRIKPPKGSRPEEPGRCYFVTEKLCSFTIHMWHDSMLCSVKHTDKLKAKTWPHYQRERERERGQPKRRSNVVRQKSTSLMGFWKEYYEFPLYAPFLEHNCWRKNKSDQME